MDTKLKSSKKFSFIIAGSLVALAVIFFMAFYPALQKQAGQYSTDLLRNEAILQGFYQSNLVFYRNIQEKTGQKEVSCSDLYLELTEEELSREEYSELDIVFEEESIIEIKRYLTEAINDIMDNWKSDAMDGLAKNMDYCVIDHKTGEILKNTDRNIESLYADKTVKGGETDYVYYVMMTYDNAGNLADISVRDENPDELLKNIQSVMTNELLKDEFEAYAARYAQYRDSLYFSSMSGNKKLTWNIADKPKNVTFIYAMTEEQKENFYAKWNSNDNRLRSEYLWEVRNAYYKAGTDKIYWSILTILAIAAILLTRDKKYCLHRLYGFHMHLEISLFGIFCLFAGFTCLIVELVCWTNSGFFSETYSRYLEFLPAVYYPVLTVGLNIMVLLLLFGAWYYFVTTLGEVFDLGIKEFLKERSLVIKTCCWFVRGCKRKKEEFKEEFLHVDLNGKINGKLWKLLIINYIILCLISSLWAFGWFVLIIYTAALFFMIRKYVGRIQEQYSRLLAAAASIAEGDLQTAIEGDFGVFEACKEELNQIQDGFRKAVEEEVKSQRMKTELITNVSHDLKTPLTAITTYIELLEDETISPEQRKEYLEVLKKKSARLKFLIEDLFEVSKASSGNVTLNPVDVDVCNLIRQVYLEYEDKAEEADLIFRFSLPEERVILKLDSQKTYRIFENLYTNAIKYAMPHTRVYVNGIKTEKGLRIEMKNMSAYELNIDPRELTERFVRGDRSRNTEGSGLGLAIARSFTGLQGGRLKVEIDGDLFKVTIEW